MIQRILAFIRRSPPPPPPVDAPPIVDLAMLPKRTPTTVAHADSVWPRCFRCTADSWSYEGPQKIFQTAQCDSCGQRLRLAHFGSDGGTCVLQVFSYRGKNGVEPQTTQEVRAGAT